MVIFLIKAVIPQIANVFVSMKIELPGLTLFLLALSDAITNYWMIMIVALIAAILSFRHWKNSDSGGYTWDALKLKMPVIKYLAKTTAVVQFSYTLACSSKQA